MLDSLIQGAKLGCLQTNVIQENGFRRFNAVALACQQIESKFRFPLGFVRMIYSANLSRHGPHPKTAAVTKVIKQHSQMIRGWTFCPIKACGFFIRYLDASKVVGEGNDFVLTSSWFMDVNLRKLSIDRHTS